MIKNIFFLLLFLSCKNPNLGFDTSENYQLSSSSQTWELPKKLDEISGISFWNPSKILCVNDEEGKIFEYNLDTKKIENSFDFGKNGDYEDLAVKGDSIYVLKSNGTIYQINNLKDVQKVEIHKTFLTKKQNTEGLFYDKEENRLLVACKSVMDINNESKNVIYEFDLENNKMNKVPAYIISKQDFKYQDKSLQFAPSGLAIHPKTNTLFVISTVGKTMIEMSLEGAILNQYTLNYPQFTQPEGIFFSKNGDLYISNETKNNKKASILKFNYVE